MVATIIFDIKLEKEFNYNIVSEFLQIKPVTG